MILVKKDVYGLGSNFLRLLDWLWYAKYSGDEVYIDWTENGKDLLSDIFIYKNPDKLIDGKTYNHYVGKFNGLNQNAINNRKRDIYYYDKYKMPNIGVQAGYFYTTPDVYYEKDFALFRNVFHDIYSTKFSPTQKFNNDLLNKTTTVLGVHLRQRSHYCLNHHNGAVAFNDIPLFWANCAKAVYDMFCKSGCEKIYVACDVEDFFICLEKYIKKDLVLKLDYNRLKGDMDWSEGQRDISSIVYNSFLDIFNLSRCDKLICGVSNFSLISLVVNTNLSFELITNLKSMHGA